MDADWEGSSAEAQGVAQNHDHPGAKAANLQSHAPSRGLERALMPTRWGGLFLREVIGIYPLELVRGN